MIQLKKGSLEARIVELLVDRVLEKSLLARELKVKESVLDASCRKLASMGILGFDVLPDKTYVRILRDDYLISGVKPVQKRELVKEQRKKQAKKYDGMMFR